MSDSIEIQATNQPIVASVRPPGSKSITNRALVCAALAEGESTLRGALVSEDTQLMIAGLRAMGISITPADDGQTLLVAGCNGQPPARQADIFVGNSGTTIRFLTALATLAAGKFRLDGVARMRARPIGDLVRALRLLGADVRCAELGDCPPVNVIGQGLPGGEATVCGDISSQFLSGLLMAAPYARSKVCLRVSGGLVSVPYVAMTRAVMEAFGVIAKTDSAYKKILVGNESKYRACDYVIEPDASAASYFWAAAAITGGEVTVTGLSQASLQGDVRFVDCLAKMGCAVHYAADSITVAGRPLRGVDVDMNAISDTVQTLAVVALFAKGPTRIGNVSHIRHKETDRIAAVATELRKLGGEVFAHEAGLEIVPGKLSPATIETYDDHRMAMSFALAGLALPGLVIRDPRCVAKTYPNFFADLGAITASRASGADELTR
ncbi:MAG: 3-phosphoshikimate 1-carboxyvinyltransferase [Pirellulales bacterium]|nr:3-phosphoshikimate 1-carboxyvinyltransferase [Pirellulales bacterium]